MKSEQSGYLASCHETLKKDVFRINHVLFLTGESRPNKESDPLTEMPDDDVNKEMALYEVTLKLESNIIKPGKK